MSVSATSKSHYDIVIVGAGMVGAAAACLLAHSSKYCKTGPLSIALIEANAASPFDDGQFDSRVAAITEKSRQLLERCGVWSTISGRRVSPFQAMEVWDAEGTGRIQFNCAEIEQPNLGHIIENSLIVEALLAEVAALGNIDFICPAKIADYQPAEEGLGLELDDGRYLQTKLLIAADGANSSIRQYFDFSTKEWDYGHKAIISTIQTERPNQQTAWQRFMPSGPLAFLPLNNEGDLHQCSIVWSQQTEVADSLLALDDQQFCDQLSAASEHCLGKVLAVEKRFAIPLRQRHAADYVVHRVALLGDAAHTIHPLAGQGANLGFADVAALVDEVERAMTRGNDIGELSTLRRYQRRRKPDNLATMVAMEGFKRLFGADNLGLRLLRNLGLTKLNGIRPLKNTIIKKSMGL